MLLVVFYHLVHTIYRYPWHFIRNKFFTFLIYMFPIQQHTQQQQGLIHIVSIHPKCILCTLIQGLQNRRASSIELQPNSQLPPNINSHFGNVIFRRIMCIFTLRCDASPLTKRSSHRELSHEKKWFCPKNTLHKVNTDRVPSDSAVDGRIYGVISLPETPQIWADRVCSISRVGRFCVYVRSVHIRTTASDLALLFILCDKQQKNNESKSRERMAMSRKCKYVRFERRMCVMYVCAVFDFVSCSMSRRWRLLRMIDYHNISL